jgi:hypothetical protein
LVATGLSSTRRRLNVGEVANEMGVLLAAI